ncbi:MAG: DUF1223 domain-containing protein [Rhodothermales bacterium]
MPTPTIETPLAAIAPAASIALPAAAPVAVVELFTSEGCSSCPPADRLLLDFAERSDDRLYPLAFHVDYWNRLGWTDPFSDEAYSQRQRAYARVIGSGRVYTPQMIVNGRTEFVGSRRAQAEQALQRALERPARTTIDLTGSLEGRTVEIAYAVKGAPEGTVLNLALVQQRAEQDVPRGENAGRTLYHANVVRAFETVSDGAGVQRLALPRGLRAEDAAVIGYAQLPATMEIVGAARVQLVGD